MPSAKKGAKLPAKRISPKGKVKADPRIINYEPESPVIRQQEAAALRRRGMRNAVWLMIIIAVLALGKIVWTEAFEKNAQFLLKQVVVNTEGPLSKAKLVAATALTQDTNLLTLSIREVRTRLERLPQVKDVKIRRDYDGQLTLDVVQRLPVAWLECAKMKFQAPRTGAGCLLDAEGVPMPCEVVTKSYLALPTVQFDTLTEVAHGNVIPERLLHVALHLLKELNTRAKTPDEVVTRVEVANAWSIHAHFASEQTKVITFGVDDIEMQLERYDRLMAQARPRQWKIATLNFIAADNTPATFHGTPDIAGLTLADRRAAQASAAPSTAQR